MQRLLPSRLNSRLVSPSQRRRAWLALWAQDRRRKRVAGATPPEPEPVTLLTGLVGYWNLDEATGETRLDATANGQHLVDLNANFPSAAGLIGNAAMNDAEYLERQLSADLSAPFSGPERSVSWWVNPSSAPSWNFQIFLSLDGGDFTNDAVQCYANSSSEFNVEYFGNWAILFGTIAYDTWTHFAATTDGTTARLHLNGEEVASSPSVASSPVKLWVGNYYGMDRSIVGSVDEVGLWDRCLTTTEISQLYNSGDGLAYEWF